MENISIFAAFTAGLISFVSPCVLPLVPAYLSFISGLSVEELRGEEARKKGMRKVILSVIAFILGFSVVFVLLGATATFLGQFLLSKMAILIKAAGVIIVVLGLHMTGLFRLRFLEIEKRFQQQKRPVGLFGAFVVGVAFAIGWSPCIGPILAGILAYAATKDTVWQGIGLLSCYSLGLGLPFLVAGVGINYFLGFKSRFGKHYRTVEIVSGVLLIVVGVLIFTNDFQRVAGYLMILGTE